MARMFPILLTVLLTTMIPICVSAEAARLTLHSKALQGDGTIQLKVGETQKVEARLGSKPTSSVRFESGNSGFFTVDKAGTLKGLHEGTTLLLVRCGNQSVTAVVHIVPAKVADMPMGAGIRRKSVKGIVVANQGGTVPVGRVERIIAHLLPYEVVGSNPFNIKSSNPSVMAADDLGKTIEALQPGRARITVSTLDGKHGASVEYRIVEVPAPPAAKVLKVDPKQFGLVYNAADEASAKANSAGLQKALDLAGPKGLNRVVLEKGKKLFVEPRDGIHMVRGVTLDLNGSEICLRPNDYERYSAFRFFARKDASLPVENAAIVNGTITGERDGKEAHLPKWAKMGSTEGGCTIIFGEGRNNGIRNLVVRKSIGFNIASGNGTNAPGTARFSNRTLGMRNVELGTLDANGKPIDEKGRIRTMKLVDLAGLKSDFYVVGYPLGYHGYPHMNSRIYDVFFYDADKKFMGLERGLYRYRRYAIPAGASFAHFSFYFPEVPKRGNADFGGAFAFVHNPSLPLDNYIIDCVIEDNFSSGFAACGGQRWIIRNSIFRRNGGRMPGCDIVWEDGWEYMQGDLIEGNTFESRLNVITCAGTGLVFRNNTFRGHSLFYGRTQHYTFSGNTVDADKTGLKAGVTFDGQTDIYLKTNRYRNASIRFRRQHWRLPGASYYARITGDRYENCGVHGGEALAKFVRCKFTGGEKAVALSGSLFDSCKVESGAFTAQGRFVNTTCKNASFTLPKAAMLTFEDCRLVNPRFGGSAPSVGLFLRQSSIAIDKPCTMIYPNNMGQVEISKCVLKAKSGASPLILFGGWNSAGAETRVKIRKLRFKTPSQFHGFVHKFSHNPRPDDPKRITYQITRTKFPAGFESTDPKGRSSNTALDLKP